MNTEEMGQAVSEALALQGKVTSLTSQLEEVTAQINNCQTQIDRLTPLIKVRDNAQAKADQLTEELSGVKEKLEVRLSAMAEEGIVLPLGEKVVNRRSGIG